MYILQLLRSQRKTKESPRLVLRTIPDDKSFQNLLPSNYRKRRLPSTRKGRIVRRSAIGVATVTLGLALSFSGGVGTTAGSSAQASVASALGLCDSYPVPGKDPDPIKFDSYNDSNSGIALPDSSNPLSTPSNKTLPLLSTPQKNGIVEPVTAYQWFGESGQSWINYNYGTFPNYSCVDVISTVGNVIANFVFTIDKLAATVAASLFGWMRSIDAFKPFLHTINDLFVGNGSGGGGLINSLFLTYLTPIVFAGALYMAWVGLVKKRSSQAIQSAVWMFGASATALVFLLHPVGLATIADTGVNYVSNNILDLLTGGQSTQGIANTNSKTPAGSLCYSNVGWRTAECDIWQVFIYSPWKSGQFGSVGDTALTNLVASPASTTVLNGVDDQAAKNILSNGFALPGNATKFNSLAMVYLETYAQNSDDASIAYNNYALYPLKAPSGYTPISPATRMGVATGIYNTELSLSATDSGDVATFSGSDGTWTHRTTVAVMDLIAMIFAVIPILLLMFNIIILQLGLVIIMIMAPFFLTAGIYPGFGRKLTMTWIEMLLSNCLKRIGNTFVLGILLFMLETIVNLQGINWAEELVFIVAATFGILGARSKLIKSMSNVSFGGSGVRSSEQIDQGIRNSLRRVRKGAVTTVKDAMYFEGGYAKGARNSLLTRSKWAGPLVNAGEDVKKFKDPLRSAKQQVAATQKKKSELMATQRLMDATASDDKSMEVWRKAYKRTQEPVPFPSARPEEVKAWKQNQQNARKILEAPIPKDLPQDKADALNARRAEATKILNQPYPIDKNKAQWLNKNNIAYEDQPYDPSYVARETTIPVEASRTIESIEQTPIITEQAKVERAEADSSHFSLRREADEGVLLVEKAALLSEQDRMSNEISRVVNELQNLNQELSLNRDVLTPDQIGRLEVSMQVNRGVETQFRAEEGRITARIRDIDTQLASWAEVGNDAKNISDRIKKPRLDLGSQDDEIISEILEVPMPTRISPRLQTPEDSTE